MSPDPTSPHRKRAHSPPSRRGDSSQAWWDTDRARSNAQQNSRPPSHLNYGDGPSSSRQRDRDRARDRERDWDRRGSNEHPHPVNGGRYGRAFESRGGSYPTSRDRNQPSPPRAHQSLYPTQHRQQPHLRHPRSPPPAARAPSPAPAPAQPAAPPAKPSGLEPEFELEIAVERDPAEILAERRRKREAILAKYARSPVPPSVAGTPAVIDTPGAASPANAKTVSEAGSVASGGEPALKRSRVAGTESPAAEDRPADEFSLEKAQGSGAAGGEANKGEEDISAADYNPELDRANDDRRKNSRGPLREDHQDAWRVREREEEEKLKLKQAAAAADEGNSDDDDDMFAVDSKPIKKVGIELAEDEDNSAPREVPMIDRSLNAALIDEFDDADGYYKLLLGEVLDNGRYHVRANLGKGMFASVVRARDLHAKIGVEGQHEEVAIKVIRSQESMYKAGQKEAAILRKLAEADPTDKKHVVRLLRTFEHRGHLCLVFENLAMNLREVVKRFGKDVGINLRAVRAYASQMFLALSLLKKCDLMHADIKPDNILVNESKSTLKLCDLGSASDTSENDITPYLVSRFYRAPEIILGLAYDPALDVWSIGCTLYELYTGKILFPGRTNNHMLQLMMELKGKPNVRQLKKGRFTEQHFDELLNFVARDKNDTPTTVNVPAKAANDLRARLLPPSVIKSLKEEELKMVEKFVDLLDKMLNLDPAKRPTPKELLSHPFLRS